MHACTAADAQSSSDFDVGRAMAEWSMMDRNWQPDESYDPYLYAMNTYYQEKPPPSLADFFPPQAQEFVQPPPLPPLPPPSPSLSVLLASPQHQQALPVVPVNNEYPVVPKGDNPREIRNKAEKQRRDKLNHSISELASMVPPVVAANRKIDKTGILRLTAHYLRAHQYVFGESIGKSCREFHPAAAQALLSLLRGFLLTTTYRGLVVVVSQNVQQYLGYAELDLLGQNVFNYVHKDDHAILKENLTPRSHLLGPNGELLVPDGPEGKRRIAEELAGEKRRFLVRFKKHGQRSEPVQYISCYVEGTFRKSDKACRGYNRCCQVVRRARARGDNPCASGNDIVFIGVVRPTTETFITESNMEAYRMEYRTRHSIDGQIMECEQRISLVAGYMTHEVHGANAMNFMHRDDVRWVVFALREMYSQHRRVGESCYRLMTKNGQFIYLKTVGVLDVDEDSRAARSFVCTNTAVDEREGKHLIQMMKRKYMLTIDNNDVPLSDVAPDRDIPEDQTVPVEDPRNIEKVILHLVTNLPSSQSEDCRSIPPDQRNESPSFPLAIIPPRKERILSAIEKIYTVIKAFKREPAMASQNNLKPGASSTSMNPSPSRSPVRQNLTMSNQQSLYLRRRIEGFGDEFEANQMPRYNAGLVTPVHEGTRAQQKPETFALGSHLMQSQSNFSMGSSHNWLPFSDTGDDVKCNINTIYEVENEASPTETQPLSFGTKRPYSAYGQMESSSEPMTNKKSTPTIYVEDTLITINEIPPTDDNILNINVQDNATNVGIPSNVENTDMEIINPSMDLSFLDHPLSDGTISNTVSTFNEYLTQEVTESLKDTEEPSSFDGYGRPTLPQNKETYI